MNKINKNILSLIMTLIFLTGILSVPIKVKAENPKNQTEITDLSSESKSVLLMEPVSGRIIYEKNSHEKLPPASVTKIMTMLLTM